MNACAPMRRARYAMAYGYTLLAPYFERDPHSPANGNTGYLPHPAGPKGRPVAPVGGYVLGIPANLAPERRAAAAEALIAFTSPEAQKLYVLKRQPDSAALLCRGRPRSAPHPPIFEAVDGMSLRDELQYWPRPPLPRIAEIIRDLRAGNSRHAARGSKPARQHCEAPRHGPSARLRN
jgi:multiple sugar transport system substrate-binding protein